jgi:N-acetylmuramoyl-L-alanine amidase
MLSKLRKTTVMAAAIFLAAGFFTGVPAYALNGGATLMLGGAPYLALDAACRQKNLNFHWDPLIRNVTVSGLEGSVKFHVGSEYFLNRGQIAKLDAKVRLYRGAVVAPLSAVGYIDALSNPKSLVSTAEMVLSPERPGAAPAKIAPPAVLTQKAAVLPLHRIRRVAIDAGHGGKDHGANGPWGLREKDLVLEMSRIVKRELEKLGIEVIMTRDSDTYIALAERANIANRKQADLFVSIHANASTSRSLQGFEVYYLSEATDDAALALQRAENSVLKFENGETQNPTNGTKAIFWDLTESENRRQSIKVANFVADSARRSVPIAARRVKSAQFYVLKWSESPAVLVEMGYVTNREDDRKLKSPFYREGLAQAIVSGILDYKREFERTDGFTE